METKHCSLCNEDKPITDFYRTKTTGKLSSRCKECIRVVQKSKYHSDQNYRNRVISTNKKSVEKNKDKKRVRDKAYQSRAEIRERRNKRIRERYQTKGITENRKQYLSNYMTTYNKEYKNRSEVKEKLIKYRKTEKYKSLKRAYHRRHKNDPKYKIRKSMSRNMWKSLKGKKDGSWTRLVDYSVEELMKHLESKFVLDMNWNNYGKWHIDHIQPVDSFNITSYKCEDFKKCWDLSNLQPLWAADNLKKSNHLNYQNNTSKSSNLNLLE